MLHGKVLIIDDSPNVLSALEILLSSEYKTVKTLTDPNQIKTYAQLDSFDLILLDMNFSASVKSGNEGIFWLTEIKKIAPKAQVIMITAYGAIDLAVKAIKNGATDFVLKPWKNEHLISTLKAAYLLKKSQAKLPKQSTNTLLTNRPNIIGDSKALQQVLLIIEKVAKTDVNVLITGENGTGKELFARELHYNSQRNNAVFVNVDMGSISENLFESELFGHVKGSFTDAKEDRIGKFEAAHGGTLFLDEIGNLSLPMQAKLLSAIQNRSIVRVGSNKEIPIDIRLVCATNSNLEQCVRAGTFREDLLYRINTIHVEVPALRHRERDIVQIADFYLKSFTEKYQKKDVSLHVNTKNKLLQYAWPGNIRELKHCMERAVILNSGTTLNANDFNLHQNNTFSAQNPIRLDEMELIMIEKALHEHDGNYSAAASQLGITRQTLYNKLKKAHNDK
ncbi:sigma-54-dependent transcriptional regulator [Aquimarina agarilytica]|uniref:sigma-54-dependent transcriptional regulator n=1 Tax=Aquimarina agarilytica TaxID=1087449 RepID=UPI000287FAF7|nr:sigma-54 dependent transcriptional regulator [Aquimarina agarilytica]